MYEISLISPTTCLHPCKKKYLGSFQYMYAPTQGVVKEQTRDLLKEQFKSRQRDLLKKQLNNRQRDLLKEWLKKTEGPSQSRRRCARVPRGGPEGTLS